VIVLKRILLMKRTIDQQVIFVYKVQWIPFLWLYILQGDQSRVFGGVGVKYFQVDSSVVISPNNKPQMNVLDLEKQSCLSKTGDGYDEKSMQNLLLENTIMIHNNFSEFQSLKSEVTLSKATETITDQIQNLDMKREGVDVDLLSSEFFREWNGLDSEGFLVDRVVFFKHLEKLDEEARELDREWSKRPHPLVSLSNCFIW
jgi:hypothetical protein